MTPFDDAPSPSVAGRPEPAPQRTGPGSDAWCPPGGGIVRRGLAIGLAAALLAPAAATAGDAATLFVVRAPSKAMTAMTTEVQVDGAGSAMLGPLDCVAFDAAAGTRELRHRWRAGTQGNPKLETAERSSASR